MSFMLIVFVPHLNAIGDDEHVAAIYIYQYWLFSGKVEFIKFHLFFFGQSLNRHIFSPLPHLSRSNLHRQG